MKKNLSSLLLLITLGIFWGAGYTIARYVITHGATPLGYTFWQAIGPALLLLLVDFIFNKASFLRTKPDYFYLSSGLLGIALPNSIMYFAASHLPAGLLATIINISPILIYVLALLLKYERFLWGRFLGVFLGFAGILLMILPKASLGSAETLPWALLALLTPCCYVVMALCISKKIHSDGSILTSSCGMLWGATLLLFPAVIATKSFYFIKIPFTLVDQLIILEIVLSTCAYLILFKLLRLAGVVFYSMVDGIVIVFALMFAALFFGDKLNRWTFAAVVLILVAITLVKQTQKEAKVKV